MRDSVDLLRNETLEEEQGWTITTFHDFFAVEATIKETASDRHGAWELANKLCDAILDLGYEFANAVTRLGVTSVWGAEPAAWRGTIELRLKPAKD